MSDNKKKLMEIFQIRIDALKEVNPEEFAGEEKDKLLVASSYAAQEYINLVDPRLDDHIDRIAMDVVHMHNGLDRGGDVNPFLVSDLVYMYLADVKNGIIDKEGNLIGDASKSKVMQVIHNSKSYGLPINGKKTIEKANAKQAEKKAEQARKIKAQEKLDERRWSKMTISSRLRRILDVLEIKKEPNHQKRRVIAEKLRKKRRGY